MPIEVRYSTTRAEIWRWYWRAWRRQLWVFHLVIGGGGFFGAYLASQAVTADLSLRLVMAGVLTALLIAFMVAYPQMRFKAEERVFRIGPEGMATTIRAKSKDYAWDEVSSVSDGGDAIVIQLRSLNGFLVPRRAFATEEERSAFLAKARQWFAAQAAALP